MGSYATDSNPKAVKKLFAKMNSLALIILTQLIFYSLGIPRQPSGECEESQEGQLIPATDPCMICYCNKIILESFPVQIRYSVECNIKSCPAPGPGFCRKKGECCPSPCGGVPLNPDGFLG